MSVGPPISRVLFPRLFAVYDHLRFTAKGFLPHTSRSVIIHLGSMSPLSSSSLPEVQGQRAIPRPNGLHLCLALLPMGVTWPQTLLPAPVVSYTTFSPLPENGRSFSVARSTSFLARVLPGIVLFGARTFLK